MSKPLRALIVEDSDNDAQLVLRALRSGGFDVASVRVDTADAMQGALSTNSWDVVLSDFSMPQFSGPAALELLAQTKLDVPFIIVSGKIGEEKAVEMMRAGARDYVLKDHLSRLAPAVERELREAQGRREHRLLEDQYRQSQKMEALGQLAGGVAHDFNNLITVISGYSELLLSALPPNDQARPLVEQIKQAGDRSASLARQLLIFSRKQAVSPRLLDLNVVVGESQKMLGRAIGETVELATDLGARLRIVKADPGQLEQVIFNLVINARDAMPNGGKIAIRTRNMTFAEGYSRPNPDMPFGSYVMLEVGDSGTGMTPEVMSHIFEPFFTTKESGKGTGLGLATVFGIVEQSTGHIAVESRPGAGTTFRIYLPEAAEQIGESNNHPPKETQSASRGNEVVLLAEDEENVRHLVNEILVKNGYTVLEAKDGKDALRLAGSYTSPIHVLVSDVVMPEMGGFELARHLRVFHPETKVLFVSGYSNLPEFRQDAPDGKIDFLLKPLSPSMLTSRVRAILDSAPLRTASPNRNGDKRP